MPDSPLTAARLAICNAIDHWGPLANTFRGKLYMERPERIRLASPPDFREGPSSNSELPYLRVRPLAGTHKWDTNQSSDVPYSLNITMWFPWDQLAAAELAYVEILYAAFNAKGPGDKDTFIGRIGCRRIDIESIQIQYVPISDNGPKVIQFSFGLTLPIGLQLKRPQ